MASVTFDTHKFIRTLRESGIPESQAEAISEAFRTAHFDAELATKTDLHELELRLGSSIRESELKLEAKLAETKAELTRWVIGVGLLQTTIIIGVLMKAAKSI